MIRAIANDKSGIHQKFGQFHGEIRKVEGLFAPTAQVADGEQNTQDAQWM
jgi:hypothetical protein